MHIPFSTYRLQFNKDFTFRHLEEIIDYLHQLGITTIYASPILQSTPGSMHGYDVVDPYMIDPEIGTLEQFKTISQKLKAKGMFWIQDIVPNHMACNVKNTRLMDVLERGPLSPYYHYFDIDWDHPSADLNGKVGLPFLGDELDMCIERGEIALAYADEGITVKYFDTHYPLSVSAYSHLSDNNLHSDTFSEFQSHAEALESIHEWSRYKREWIKKLKDQKSKIETTLRKINEDKVKLNELLNQQHYILRFWKRADEEINYRRFFTVNELICLRMEDARVFDEYHQFIHSLYQQGLIHGLRIDHIDGLNDPAQYIKNLRKLFGNSCYIIAEKILEAKEEMPQNWPLEGTSGYEFLSYVNQLITDRSGTKKLLNFYREVVPELPAYDKLVLENKRLILSQYMQGEWNNLVHHFKSVELLPAYSDEEIKDALALFMLSLPVYRIYPEKMPLSGNDLELINEAFRKALAHSAQYQDLLKELHALFTGSQGEQPRGRVLKFLKRLMQFTGPLTAKGVEDTTFYVYNPLISHDEVGDAPSTLGISIQSFHNKMVARQKFTPLSLNATATHDTKRGEDARLRLNMISEFPEVWINLVRQWFDMNARLKTELNGRSAPMVNDEYFIYQALIGGFPEDLKVSEEWIERVKQYLVKAVREAKVNSDWAKPDEDYENACLNFITQITHDDAGFLKSFLPFMEIVSRYASLYALAQILIKITAPGIPDTYQGCELWDLSFVDPDNRRPVDYKTREALLAQVIEKEKEGRLPLLHFLKINRARGLEKLFVTWKALNFRKTHPELFVHASYLPLEVKGKQVVVMAYARHYGEEWIIVMIPLALGRNRESDQPYASDPDDQVNIILPENAPPRWKNIFTAEEIETTGKFPVFDAFKDFPVAVWHNTSK
jgi:(1->4)-alpha-D-glucan 1-alpha-D-glucosylmutase